MIFLNIKRILKKYRIVPVKRLGQNFLVDKTVLKKIIEFSEISKKDVILEVGAGIGNLTLELAKKSKKVITIEKDKRMVEILKESLKNYKNVEIIQGDILHKIRVLESKLCKGYKVVANIPYYLTSILIRKLLEMKCKPNLMVLMVQKEVGERICAKPPNMSLLSVSVQFYATPEIVSFVPRESFWPPPRVDSAIIKITPRKFDPKISPQFVDQFFKIVKIGFSHRRKQLVNNFSKALEVDKIKVQKWFLRNKINPKKRAQELSVDEWIKLSKNFPFKI